MKMNVMPRLLAFINLYFGADYYCHLQGSQRKVSEACGGSQNVSNDYQSTVHHIPEDYNLHI